MRSDKLRELIGDLGALSRDPLRFVLYAFPWGEGTLAGFDGPDEWQKDVLCSVRDKLLTPLASTAGQMRNAPGTANIPHEAIREAVASGHGIGKSALVAWLILWAMATHEETKGVVTANTETQLKS